MLPTGAAHSPAPPELNTVTSQPLLTAASECPRVFRRARRGATAVVAAFLSVLLAACQDTTSPVTSGGLSLELSGLPAGVVGDVQLQRGKRQRLLHESATLGDLESGAWTITAAEVTVDGVVYAPQPASQTVNVNGRSVGSARVVWTPTTGTLALAVLGLPVGTDADVQVQSGSFSRTITASSVLSSLTPGTYAISARDVRAPTGLMRPTQPTQSLVLSASAINVSASVTYAPAPAAVDVTISGLPGNTPAVVSLTAPDGSFNAITADRRISPAAAGRWQMSAANVQSSGFTYAPSPATRDTTVSAGDTLRVPVAYALSTGAIALAVTGLPQGATGFVTITGPGGFAEARTSTATMTDLAPGTYTVRADSVVRNGLLWRASTGTQQVTVSASLVASPVAVAYAAVSGTLVVSVSGVPNGATGSVQISGPYGFARTITTTTVITPAAVGTYAVTAASLVTSGVPYAVVPATVNKSVIANGRDSLDMNYQNVAGSLAVTVNGLPGGVDGALTLTGNSQTINIIGSTVVSNLGPGSYTLAAGVVTSGATSYAANPPSQNITITPQTQSAATVNYGVASAAIDLIVYQAYLTQATQKFDGSVALVAGRDALLRVFAHADRSNVLTPTVRARIYDGATLLQTYTINGPVAGVPTAVSEGTMSSSWNVLVPGANIRAATRVLVDIDPTNTIAESSETNNIWPSSGTPQSITVNTVPTFTVRFVPIAVKNLTGNVSLANMSQYLTTTRRMWPIFDVAADVHAPFTSSADTLVSNDSNGKWLTVLSEMNTLRSAEGAPATMHYYGVVKTGYNSGVAGYGYVPGRAAVGWDHLPSGDGVAAHEWGHNFNRPHAPCGGAGGPDPSYPYAGGAIGVFGWNPTTNAIVATTVTDLMGYCNPTWISDYNWTRVMTYRQGSGFEASPAAAGEGLLVWGRVTDGVVQLEPSFRISAPASVAVPNPTHRVEALDVNGNVLLDLPIAADRVDHATAHDERQFAVIVPWSSALEQALTRVRVRDVRTPLLATVRASATAVSARLTRGSRATTPLAMPDPQSAVDLLGGGRARVRWNSAQYPMAMVRDAATGEIMAYVRRPGDLILTGGRRLEVHFSDGVRSVVRPATP